MDYKSIYYPESKFGGFTDIDGTMAFYIRVNSLINHNSIILDVGCGRGAYKEDLLNIRKNIRIFKGKCKKVIGIDVDKNAKNNPFLDEFYLIESNKWPIDDDSIDICICDNVLEHIENPEIFFSESRRVIKKGGYLCIRTPNILSYFGLFSKIIPSRFHCLIINKVQNGRKSEDLFPAFYRCNTIWKIRSMLCKYGFDGVVYGYDSEPGYLSFSRVFYFLGVLYQKFSPNLFKVSIFAFGRRV